MEEQVNYIDEAKELDGTATDSPESNVKEQTAETPVAEPKAKKAETKKFSPGVD